MKLIGIEYKFVLILNINFTPLHLKLVSEECTWISRKKYILFKKNFQN